MPLNNKNTDPLEQLLKDTFDEYTIPATKNSWIKIKKDLFKKQFLKFNISQFNIYYLSTLLTVTVTVSFVNFNSEKEIKNDIVEQEQILPLVKEKEDIVQKELIDKAEIINENDSVEKIINTTKKTVEEVDSPTITQGNNTATTNVKLNNIVETNETIVKPKEETNLSNTMQVKLTKHLPEKKEELLIDDLEDSSTLISNKKESEDINSTKEDSIIEEEIKVNSVVKVDTIEKVVRVKRNRRNKGKKRKK